MNILRFLREQAKGYDCNVCGQNHSRSDIRVLGKLESAWIVRVTCAKCQTSFKLLVVVDDEHADVSPVKGSGHGTPPLQPAPPVVSADEVLDAHEFFQNWDGSVSTILGTARPAAGATPADGPSEPDA
ncbi:MAG: hypothetical protein NVSMB8_05910 [Candidatus Limnocylindrales bacterium]